jgi:lambda family phage portal protein
MILDRLRGLIGGAPAKPAVTSQYMRGGATPFFFNWRPALRDGREDVREAYYFAAARAIDAIQNSGWLAGAVSQAVASTIGTGLRLAAKPDLDALGWSKDTADQWSRRVERAWEAWAGNPMECDAGGRFTLGKQCDFVLRNYYSHGEAVALLPMISRPNSETRTKVRLIPPHKLLQDSDGWRMFQGVVMDAWGLPLQYRMSLRVQQAYEEIVMVNARDAIGRPQVLHIFEGGTDQVRGISPMTPALRIVRQFDQLSDATLTASLIQAIFAATIESDAPTDAILQALQDDDEQGVGGANMGALLGAKAAWYDHTKIDLGRAGKIAHLFPGEKLTFNGAKSPNAAYEAFAKFLLREIARCLGMTFETLTGDYTGATYSSVRMATSEMWPITLGRRTNIAGRFYQGVYEAWLEEEIEAGRIQFPGGFASFLKVRKAVSRAEWRGPAKPQADDLKTAKAYEVYKSLGVMSDEQICAELGSDWEDVYEQRAREMQLRKKLELPEGDAMAPPEDPEADALLKQPEN